MSVIIESTAAADRAGQGSIDGAISAARACLERAGLRPNDVDVLVNVGVYRDGNVVEPANSALIQLGLGMHPDYVAGSGRSTFSFDLRNGACGVLDAVHAATALLHNGTAEKVLIVGSEAHPGGVADTPEDFPYAETAAALLLARSTDPGAGFGPVRVGPAFGRASRTDPGVRGYLDLKAMGTDGRRTVSVDVADGYADMLEQAATEALTAYLAAHPVTVAAATLVVNNAAPGLADSLAAAFGFARGVQRTGPDAGSAGLGLAIHDLRERLSPGDELVLLAAGAGPVAGCAHYVVGEDGR
ncbi:hypothetical protein [Nocardia aurea]|uniref:Beta-ketoacyl-[acyl-carrier-protein] synthase III N-terminal domain-containing protein n=1 Tax=Nocardia aurea TaxID=2144174 RepID=A0ABV3FXU8_9NOCA